MAASESRLTRQDRLVLLWLHVVLLAGLAAAVLGLGWISLAPNRLLAGLPLSAREALGGGVVLILAAALAAEWPRSSRRPRLFRCS